MQLRNAEGALLSFHQGRALLKQSNPGLGGPEVFPPAAGCGDAGRRGKGGGEPGAGKPGGRAGASKRRDVEERGAGGFIRGVGTAAHGGSRRILPVLSPDSGGRGGKRGGEEGKPAASPTREPRGAESGKKRRRSLRSAGGGGDFPSTSGTEGARAGKERGQRGAAVFKVLAYSRCACNPPPRLPPRLLAALQSCQVHGEPAHPAVLKRC